MGFDTIQDYLNSFVPPTLSLFFTAIISMAIGVYLEKFKTRLTILRYKIYSNPIGTTTQDNFWGKITVNYNDREIKHLNFFTIEIVNDSNTDLENLYIDTWVDSNSQILGSTGFYNEGGSTILLEQGYYNYYMDVLRRYNETIIPVHEEDEVNDEQDERALPIVETTTQLQNEISWILTHKKFFLPVLNRHTTITLNLLAENFGGIVPTVNVNILHKSVKLVLRQNESNDVKKIFIMAFTIGVLIFLIGTFILSYYYPNSKQPIIILSCLGLVYLLLGYSIQHIIKMIKYALS